MNARLSATMILCLLLSSLRPSAVRASEYTTIIETGILFYDGGSVKSLTGSTGYMLQFVAEKRKQVFRPFAAARLEYASGSATLSGATTPFTLLGGGFNIGANIVLLPAAAFQPFVGASGILGWGLLKLSSPPSSVDANTQGIEYGYELGAGVDMHFGSADGRAFRLETRYSFNLGALGNQSGFELSAFKILLGLSF